MSRRQGRALPTRLAGRAGRCGAPCCLFFGVVLLVSCAGGVWYMYSRATAKPPPPPEAKQSAQVKLPPRTKLSDQIAKQLTDGSAAKPDKPKSKAKGEAESKARPKPKAKPKPKAPRVLTLDIRPQDIVEMLAPTLEKEGVHDIKVYFGSGTIATQGSVKAKDREQEFSARARPHLSGEEIKIDIIEARLGALPIPGASALKVTRSLETKLENRVRGAAPKGKQLVMDSLKVTPGRIIVKAHVKS